MTALGMAATGWLVGVAIHLEHGVYSRTGILLISVAIGICCGTLVFTRRGVAADLRPGRFSVAALVLLLAFEIPLLTASAEEPFTKPWIAFAAGCALLAAIGPPKWRLAAFALAVAVIAFVAVAVVREFRDPRIDVFSFQQEGARALLEGASPYGIRISNLYRASTPFYGPGVIDPVSNMLTVGLPYPPFSLLLVVPAYVLGGDCRFADIIAVVLTVALMASARPGRWSTIVAALFLLTPEALYVLRNAWTEALMALTFSATMFAALRWRAALPWALGAFFATKQNSVLAVPLVWLLVDGIDRGRQYAALIGKACLFVAVVTLPFVVWDPSGFWRSVVAFQFMQPLRIDALSHLVWMHNRLPRFDIVQWTPFALLVPSTVVALVYAKRSPAGFAAAVTLVNLTFIAFSKQAFANYYYFTIATAFWAAAADDTAATSFT